MNDAQPQVLAAFNTVIESLSELSDDEFRDIDPVQIPKIPGLFRH